MAINNRKWFWAAVLAWFLSLAAMFATKECAGRAAMLTARAAQARATGEVLDGSKMAVSRYLLGVQVFDVIALIFGALMLAAWGISYFKGERARYAALLAMLSALCLFYFVMV